MILRGSAHFNKTLICSFQRCTHYLQVKQTSEQEIKFQPPNIARRFIDEA